MREREREKCDFVIVTVDCDVVLFARRRRQERKETLRRFDIIHKLLKRERSLTIRKREREIEREIRL